MPQKGEFKKNAKPDSIRQRKYNSKPSSKKDRASRNAARQEAMKDGKVRTSTNHSGGIQGGISNGEEIFFRVAFKPVSTLMTDQQTISRSGDPIVMKGKGRHDTCFVPRAVPIVEAMAAFVIADHLLRYQAYRLLLAQAVK